MAGPTAAKRPRIGEVVGHSSTSPTTDVISTLPDELLIRIFALLGELRDIVSISLTSRRFRVLAQDNDVWEAAVKRDFPQINIDMYSPIVSWIMLYKQLSYETLWKWEENSTQLRCLRTLDLARTSQAMNVHLLRDGTIVVYTSFSATSSDDEIGRLLFLRENCSNFSLDHDYDLYAMDGSSVAALKGCEGFHCKWGNGHYEVTPFERKTVERDIENLSEESRFLVKNLLCRDSITDGPSAGCIAARYTMEADTEGRKCLSVYKTVANVSLRMEYSKAFESKTNTQQYDDYYCFCSSKIAFSLCANSSDLVVIWNAETGKLLGEVDIGTYNHTRVVCEVRDGTILLEQDVALIESQYVMIDAAYTPPKVRKFSARVGNTLYIPSLSPILVEQLVRDSDHITIFTRVPKRVPRTPPPRDPAQSVP